MDLVTFQVAIESQPSDLGSKDGTLMLGIVQFSPM